MTKGIWYLVKVECEHKIGTDEIERWKVVDSTMGAINIGGDFNFQTMHIKCDKAVPASPTSKELPATPKRPPVSTTQSSETENSQTTGGVVGSLSMANAFMEKITKIEYTIQSVDNKYNELLRNVQELQKKLCLRSNVLYDRDNEPICKINKLTQEMESRTEQLSDDHRELKDAFEAECDHYDSDIKHLRQQLSELQQAFIKDKCTPTIKPDPVDEADKQLKGILHNLTKEQPIMRWAQDKTIGKPCLIKVTTDVEKGIRIEFI